MTFKLTEAEYEQLDAFLGSMLDAYKSGTFTKLEVVGVVSHLIAAAAWDNEGEVRRWLTDPEVLVSWMDPTDTDRT